MSEPVWRRLRWWWLHRRADVHMLSFPKCGRTWLVLLVGKAIEYHLGKETKNPLKLRNMRWLSRDIPLILQHHDGGPEFQRPLYTRRRWPRPAIPPPGPAISMPAEASIPRASPPGSIRWPNPSRTPSSTSASRGKNTPRGADDTDLPNAGAASGPGAPKQALKTPTGPGSP